MNRFLNLASTRAATQSKVIASADAIRWTLVVLGAAVVLLVSAACRTAESPAGGTESGDTVSDSGVSNGGISEGAVSDAEFAPTAAVSAADPTRDFETDPQGRVELRRIHGEILSSVTVSDGNMVALREIHEIWPDQSDVIQELVLALTRRRDWEGLAALYEERDSWTTSEQMALGATYIKLGRIDEALAILIPLTEVDPVNIDYAYHTALALYRSGDSEAAGALIDRLWNAFIHARRVDALALRGKVFIDAGQLKRARSAFEQALEIDDSLTSREAYDGLGRTLVALGEREAAQEVFDRLEAMNAGVSQLETHNLQQYTKIRAMIDAWETGDIERAEALIEEILPVIDDRFKSLVYEYALELYNSTGRPDKAREAAAEAAHYDRLRIDR